MCKVQNHDMSKAEEIVERQLSHYNSNDLEGFLSTYTEDVEIYDLPSGELRFKSKEALRERYEETFKLKPKARIVNRIVDGNKVIDHEFYIREGMVEEGSVVAIYEVDLEQELISKVWFLK